MQKTDDTVVIRYIGEPNKPQLKNSLQIKKFDMKSMFKPKVEHFPSIANTPTVAIFGRREVGKTTLVCDILRHSKIENTTIISGTESHQKQYATLDPSLNIHSEYNDEILVNFIKKQKSVLKKWKDAEPTSEIDPRTAIVFDNYDGINQNGKNKLTNVLLCNGRCFRIMIITTVQHPISLTMQERIQCDYFFIFRDPALDYRKKLYERIASIFPSFETFCATMDQICDDYTFLVIANYSNSNKLEDMIFWYKVNIEELVQYRAQERGDTIAQECGFKRAAHLELDNDTDEDDDGL